MAYSWNDGMAGYETGANDTGFMVLFPQNRGPGDVTDTGYDITVVPQPQASTVVFGIGLWQAEADVNIYADGALYETKEVSADGTSQAYKYQIKVPAGVTLKLEVRQTKTLSQWGNMSFSGLAVGIVEDEVTLDVKQNLLSGDYAMNLSQIGDIDWLHMKGNGLNNFTQIKKAGSSSIAFNAYGTVDIEGKMNRGGRCKLFGIFLERRHGWL
ncbi:hypothetical protein OMP38_03620 [Cohnella ginsengisoli]|uniref:Uncharacterized protein n=1 Tax=Cohnella ginsengisoli TaxID=425004 RepID=A0A9X4QLF9_9BACL|nr:hypothetical protein [Cohnella ginsengisoli]MDG0790042.1 hypothetical protein [Cohnella ginsengisoli]